MEWAEHKTYYGRNFFTKHCHYVVDDTALLHDARPAMQHLLDELEPLGSIIDCGCATGTMLSGIHQLEPDTEIYGFDLSEYAISHARNDIKHAVAVLDCATEAIPFPDQHFDLCVAVDFYEHQHDSLIERVIKETARVAAKYIFMRQPFVHFCWDIPADDHYVVNLTARMAGYNDVLHEDRLALIDRILEIRTAVPDPNCPYHPQERGREFFLEIFKKCHFDEIIFSEDFYKMPNPLSCSSWTTMVVQRQGSDV